MNNINDYALFVEKQTRLADLVQKYADITQELADLPEKGRADLIAQKVRSENFEVAVVGSFKNGKSTFINALLGKEVLQSRVTPCTAIINEVRYGETESAVVFLKEDLSEEQILSLPSWVKKEIREYGRAAGIKVPAEKIKEVVTIPHAEEREGFETPYAKMILYYPLELLKNHVVITDTPGLNELEARTRITTNHLGHADAIIMVFAADKLCSRVEMEFVQNDLKNNGFCAPFFVVNRMDVLRRNGERTEVEELALSKLISLTQKGKDGIFFLSARDALDAAEEADTEAWEISGFSDFERDLADYLIRERGKEKLLPPAKLVLDRLKNVVLAKTLPRMQSALDMDLQNAVIRQQDAQESLDKALKSRRRIVEIIEKNSASSVELLSKMIDGFYAELVEKMRMWIDSYEPVGVDKLNPKEKADGIQKQILEYVAAKIKEETDKWYRESYQVALLQQLELLEELIKKDRSEFQKELQNSQTIFFGSAEMEEGTTELSDAFFSTDSIVQAELFKNIGKSVGIAASVGIAVDVITGLMNPVLGIITALGALTIGYFKSTQKMVPEIKEGVKKSVAEVLKKSEKTSCAKLKGEMEHFFEDYGKKVDLALGQKYDQAQKEIEGTIDKLTKGIESINAGKEMLSSLQARADDLRIALQEFVDEYDN